MSIKGILFLSLLSFLLFHEKAFSVSQSQEKLLLKGDVAGMGYEELNHLKVLSSSQDFANCLKPQIGDEQLNFTDPTLTLEDIITKYFNVYPNYVQNDLDSRVAIFINNFKNIVNIVAECVNQDPSNQTRVGFTSRIGLDPSEYLIQNITLMSSSELGQKKSCEKYWKSIKPLPDSFNWFDQGKVTKPKDQDLCDVCYIFASIGCLESSYLIQHNKMIDFSEQDVMNCILPGQDACRVSASPIDVFSLIKKRGLVSEEKVPYVNRCDKCVKHKKWSAKIDNWCFDGAYANDFLALTDDELKTLIQKKGPVVVAMDGGSHEFQGLSTKIFNGPCLQRQSHTLLLIGWTPQYWIVKNSWGTSWGENGFAWIKRSIPGVCGLKKSVYSAWVK